MAATVGMAFVKVMPTAKGFTNALKSEIGDQTAVGGAVGMQVGDGIDRGVQSKAGALKARMAEMGKVMAVGAGVGLALLGKQAVDAASQQEQALGGLSAVFRENSAAMLENARNSTTLNLSTTEYATAATALGAQLGNLGVAQSELMPMTTDLMGAASDMAAQFGGTTMEAVEALTSAFRGESDPIERYGVSLSATRVNAEMAATGLSKTDATLKILNEQLTNTGTIGAFNRELDTTASKTENAAAQWKNAQASLGTALLPVMTQAASIASKLLGWFNELSPSTQSWIVKGTLLAGALTAVGYAVSVLVTAIKGFAAFAKIATAAQWLWNAAMTANPIGLIIVAIAALVAAFVLLYRNNEGFRKAVQAAWAAIKVAIDVVIEWFKRYALPAFKAAFEVLKRIIEVYVRVYSTIFRVIITAVSAVVDWFRTVLIPMWSRIFEVIGTIISRYVSAWIKVFGTVRDAVVWVIDGIRRAVEWIATSLSNVWDRVRDLINRIRSLPGVSAILNVAGFASGGMVGGMGAGDSQLIAASPGEFVLNRKMVAQAGGGASLEAWRRSGVAPAGGAASGPAEVTVNIYNPQPEPTSQSLPRAIRKTAQLAGAGR